MMPEKMKQHVHLNVGVVLVHMKSIYFTSLKIHGKTIYIELICILVLLKSRKKKSAPQM
jgi:hypothetical protein